MTLDISLEFCVYNTLLEFKINQLAIENYDINLSINLPASNCKIF